MAEKRQRRREYTIADLQAMVDQLGGTLSLSLEPAEFRSAGGDVMYRCDFCGRPRTEVAILISAPRHRTHICDECVGVCVEMVAKEKQSTSRQTDEPAQADDAVARAVEASTE